MAITIDSPLRLRPHRNVSTVRQGRIRTDLGDPFYAQRITADRFFVVVDGCTGYRLHCINAAGDVQYTVRSSDIRFGLMLIDVPPFIQEQNNAVHYFFEVPHHD